MTVRIKRLFFAALAAACLAELTHFGHAAEFFCGHDEGGASYCCSASARVSEPMMTISAPEAPPAYPPAAPKPLIQSLLPEDIFHPPAV